MPKFFFHIRDGGDLVLDEQGIDLQDVEATFSEARASARDLALQKAKAGVWSTGKAVELTDSHGKVLLSVPLQAFLSNS